MKFKKAITILLCAVMSLSMFACGTIDMPDSGTGDPNGVVPTGKTYNVTFNVNATGVTNPTALQIGDGKTIGSKLVIPTRDGYTFVGWFDSNNKQYTGSTKITGDVMLTARWESTAAKLEYEENISSWAKPGHLYIHYKRFNHVASEEGTPPTSGTGSGAPNYNSAIDSAAYADWGLWSWPKKNANGRLFNAAWIDASGAVYDVDLTATYNDCGWDAKKQTHQGVTNTFAGAEQIGVQIFQISTRASGTFWANDGGDNTLIMEDYKRDTGDYHWFINEAHVSDGSPTYAEVTYVDPYKDDTARTNNPTKTSGANIIVNSAADNSGKYPIKNVNNEFNCSNGYQIFIASFADSDGDGMGDIQGIIDKLGYLQSLNVDLLWLTPFQDSTNYHGYDINDYYTVDSRWGSTEKYRELISKAKEKGIKIVMDFVLNHTSLSNEWFVKSQTLVKEQNVKYESNDTPYAEVDYRQFYSWITKAQYDKLGANEKTHWYKDNYDYYFYSSFGSSMPELNYDYQPVRDAILDVCYKWMQEGLAGFRLDAVKHIYMCNEVKGKNSSVNYASDREFGSSVTVQPNGQISGDCDYVKDNDSRFNYDMKRNLNFYREFNYRLKTKYPQAFVVGENLDGYDARTAAFYQGIDSQFDFSLYYNIPRGILHAGGVSGAFGDGLGAIYNRYSRGYTGYTKYNTNYIGGQFTSNHDLPRARDRVNVTNVDENGDNFGSFYSNNSIDGKKHIYNDELHNNVTTEGSVQVNKITASTERLKVYYAALMTLPGVTWLYYGDEIGMSGLMQHTLSCKDADKKTSSTDSDPHEDIIYRQPMKWNASTTAEYDDATHTSHGNAAFKIGYGDILCELVGVNATEHIPSVAECSTKNANGTYTFKTGTLIDWVAKLNKMRKDKGITGKSRVTLISQGQDNCSYTVTGTNGSITVKFSTSSISGTGYNGLKFDGSKFHVLIS